MKSAAVGFRVHSGWAAVVALTITKNAPAILTRERLHLVKTFSYRFRQPYHTARRLPLEEGRNFISTSRSEARRIAFRAIERLHTDLAAQGYELSRSGLLLASGRPLPRLPQILASHSLIHTADGELFREALLHAGGRCGLDVVKIKERELLDTASRTLRINPAVITRRITELGRPLGPPWSRDEKLAALAAWFAFASVWTAD